MMNRLLFTLVLKQPLLFFNKNRLKCFLSSNSNEIQLTPNYLTIESDKVQESLYTIKNSKFYAKSYYLTTIDDALSFVNKYKDVKASHNCWAFTGLDIERSSDDGEPSGTAGRPILSAIQEHNLKNIVVLVTRYFGGIKLGTGGLSRAYQASALQLLTETSAIPVYDTITINITSINSDIGILHQIIQYFNNKVIKSTHINTNTPITPPHSTTQKGHKVSPVPRLQAIDRLHEEYSVDNDTVTLLLKIQTPIKDELCMMLTDLTKGRGNYEVIDW